MKVIASYMHPTLGVYRRIIFPFTTLASRSHSFYFQQVLSLEDVGNSCDVVVLQNFILSDQERPIYANLCEQKSVIYDLTDPSIVEDPSVQFALSHAAGVTVPTAYLKSEIEFLANRIEVLPSTLDLPHFFQSNRLSPPKQPVIGCFGPHAFDKIKGVIEQLKERKKNLLFLGDAHAAEHLGDLIQPLPLDPALYPETLRSCMLLLLPTEGRLYGDPIWAYEAGIQGRPVMTSTESVYSDILGGICPILPLNMPEKWVESILLLLSNPRERRLAGNELFKKAYKQRNIELAHLYLRAYAKMLPHLA